MFLRTLAYLAILTTCSLVTAADWPAFRGPAGNGLSDEKQAPLVWSKDKNVVWKVQLPDAGNSSPIVSAGKVFLTCSQDKGKLRSLYCFDRQTGKELWVRTIEFGEVTQTHSTNPHCASTPAANGKQVVVWHGAAGMYCYDYEGKELWSRKLGDFKHTWGDGTSPVLYKDRVILSAGPGKTLFVTALKLENGETIWETPEPVDGDGDRNSSGKYMGSWSTPVIASIDGKDQIVVSLPTRVNGYDPQTGAIIWTCEGLSGRKGDLSYSSPLIGNGLCVVVGGFNGPSFGFKLGGTGNITETNRLWREEPNPQSIGSGVFLDGYLYIPNAERNTVRCLDPNTGKSQWESERINQAGNAWGSIVLAGGHLYVTTQEGTTLVFKPNPKQFELVASNVLGEQSNSTPAISDGQIFLRTFNHLYCIAE